MPGMGMEEGILSLRSDSHLCGPPGHYQSLLLVTTCYPFHALALIFSISTAGPESVEKGGTQPKLASQLPLGPASHTTLNLSPNVTFLS